MEDPRRARLGSEQHHGQWLWRSLKYERIRLYSYGSVGELKAHVAEWMSYYNHQRKHQHLGYQTPWSLYEAAATLPEAD